MARGHWGVEALHWTLDETFGEDALLKRKDNTPRNYLIIRKFALNATIVVKDKLSLPLTHIKASHDPGFHQYLLITAGFKLL